MGTDGHSTQKDPDWTHRRILEAIVQLHEERGPAATTISAIAERAGVQRLTVYRHFPDERTLMRACSSHWRDRHPTPDPASWAGLEDPRDRLRAALSALYAYYRDGRNMLANVLEDEDEVPALAEVMVPFHDYLREVAASLATGWGVQPQTQRRLRAAVGHAVRFSTYRSLAAEGLSSEDAAGLMAGFVSGVAHGHTAEVK